MFGITDCLTFALLLADPGKARDLSINTIVIHSISHPFPPTALRRRHAQTVRNGASRHNISYVTQAKDILHFKRTSTLHYCTGCTTGKVRIYIYFFHKKIKK